MDKASNSRRNAIMLFVATFVGIALVGYWQRTGSAPSSLAHVSDMELRTFKDEQIRLGELRGQGVLLNFWASWCEPCRAEAALFEEAWRREQDKAIVFLGVNYQDRRVDALEFIDEFSITYPNGADVDARIYRQFRVRGLPQTFFIAPDGQVVQVVAGPLLNNAQLERYLDEIRP